MCVRCIVLKDVILDWIVLCEVMSNWDRLCLLFYHGEKIWRMRKLNVTGSMMRLQICK